MDTSVVITIASWEWHLVIKCTMYCHVSMVMLVVYKNYTNGVCSTPIAKLGLILGTEWSYTAIHLKTNQKKKTL